MILARVDGTLIPATCPPSMVGKRTIICQPLGADGEDIGTPILAYDPLVSGLHQQVLISTDGSQTRQLVGDPHSPLRNFVLALVDPTLSSR
ncbi:EutN/CcmL family microcompartment protein [Actomonas aquatica]|uniref:EutN/CcmL family microcompartment protein n=1 Tax=Actomonas aquatica TaxID=2866162 RepID=A0ABZ1CBG6_9BACT|nr:EutN/CcmL family microcompartment protein [Opitutus sp. WL0086]WRQ87645.1 EutN/CcmL family microcompartment protein [Opitutus sp. WL0086]